MTTAEQSFDVPSLADQLGSEWFPESVRLAYWLGVSRALVYEYHLESAFELCDELVPTAEKFLADLKAELAKERQT